jgi:hypothetical protein
MYEMAIELTPSLIDSVLTQLAEGQSLRSICAKEGMPQIQQIMRLRLSDKDFEEQYARARELQAEMFGDELKEIADNGENDWMEDNRPYCQGWRQNGEAVARSRLRFDQRRWWMSKVLPQRYGDKIGVEHSGGINVGLADSIAAARKRIDE